MTRSLVTGGSGFIGRAIAEYLLARGDEVVVLDLAVPPPDLRGRVRYVAADIRDWPLVLDATAGCHEVYHCSGVLGTHELLSQTHNAVEVNVLGGLNVLEAARIHGVQGVLLPTKPNEWRNTYTITKVALEQFGLMYWETMGLPVTVLRWYNAYGPGQHWWPVRKAVPTFILSALDGRPITIYGSGKQTVDMIHVADIARIAVESVGHKWAVGRVADVGSGIAISVNDLAHMVNRLCDRPEEHVVHIPMREGEPEDSDICAEASLIEEHDIALYPLEQGLRETIAWYAATVPESERTEVLDFYGIPSSLSL